jgi:hypothetical protein
MSIPATGERASLASLNEEGGQPSTIGRYEMHSVVADKLRGLRGLRQIRNFT